MADRYVGNIIPAPGFFPGDTLTDDELLASTARFSQHGATLAAGQGIVDLGTVMAQRTSDKLWVKYNNSGSGGAEVARGILRRGIDTGTDSAGKRYQGNIVYSGILKLDRIKGSDSAALTDLNARTDSVLNVFIL